LSADQFTERVMAMAHEFLHEREHHVDRRLVARVVESTRRRVWCGNASL
jgi:hypothetical protein